MKYLVKITLFALLLPSSLTAQTQSSDVILASYTVTDTIFCYTNYTGENLGFKFSGDTSAFQPIPIKTPYFDQHYTYTPKMVYNSRLTLATHSALRNDNIRMSDDSLYIIRAMDINEPHLAFSASASDLSSYSIITYNNENESIKSYNHDDDSLSHGILNTITVNKRGQIYAANQYGLCWFDGNEWHIINPDDGLAYTTIHKVKYVSDKRAIIVFQGRGGVQYIERGVPEPYDSNNQPPLVKPEKVLVHNDEIWISNNSTLSVFKNREWHTVVDIQSELKDDIAVNEHPEEHQLLNYYRHNNYLYIITGSGVEQIFLDEM